MFTLPYLVQDAMTCAFAENGEVQFRMGISGNDMNHCPDWQVHKRFTAKKQRLGAQQPAGIQGSAGLCKRFW